MRMRENDVTLGISKTSYRSLALSMQEEHKLGSIGFCAYAISTKVSLHFDKCFDSYEPVQPILKLRNSKCFSACT